MKSFTVLVKPASSLCNMRCSYCFYRDESENRVSGGGTSMSQETARNIIDKVFTYVGRGGHVSFIFQGGEPLLAGAGFFRDFFAYAEEVRRKYGATADFSVQTNGLLLDEAFAELFTANGVTVGLSLDGTKAYHDRQRPDASGEGTFNRVMKALSLLKLHKIRFSVLCVITKASASHAEELISFFVKNGVENLQFIPQISPVGNPDGGVPAADYGRFLSEAYMIWMRTVDSGFPLHIRDFDNYIAIASGYPAESCALQGKCGFNAVVEADGSVYPCDFYCTDEYFAGNINERSFEELERSGAVKKFIGSSLVYSEECRACAYLPLCRTGCRRTKDERGRQRLCEAYKTFFGMVTKRK